MFDLLTFLSEDEIAAITVMRDRFGLNVLQTYQFWESAVARMCAGRTTSARCPWDVELDYPTGDTIRIEVKFSRETGMRFATGPRRVYKFAEPKGRGTPKTADVMVFVGVDDEEHLDLWVAPGSSIRQSRSITVTVPRTRVSSSSNVRSPLIAYGAPFDQLVPAVLDAWRCHLRYDRDHHAQTRSTTRTQHRAAAGELPLFEVAR